MIALEVNEVKFVPPLATGSVPVTSVLKLTKSKLIAVPLVLKTRLAVAPDVHDGAPVLLVTKTDVDTAAKPLTAFAELAYNKSY